MDAFSSMFAKRLAIRLYDCLALLIVAALLSCAFIQPAYAYVDPSVMTYTIQAVAGVAVALSAVAGVALRRTRRVIFRLLKIDENANKEKDPVVRRISPDDAAAHAEAREAAAVASRIAAEGRPAPKLGFKQRVLRALLASFFACFTLLFVAPYELVVGNPADLIYGIDTVFPVLLVMTLVATAVLTLAASVVPGRAFDFALCLITAVGACFWVQALFLNSALPGADGTAVRWEDYDFANATSCLTWLIVCLTFLVLCIKKRTIARAVCLFVPAALVLTQVVGLAGLALNPVERENTGNASSYFMTQDGLYDVSPSSNVIVFVLDTVDSVVVEQVRAEYPDLFSEYTGFTYYPNALSSFIPTRYGVPFMLTGSRINHGQTWSEYCSTRFDGATFLNEIADAGYSVGVYTDAPENGSDYVKENAFNVIDSSNASSLINASFSPFSAAKMMAKTAVYRDVIWILKPYFHYYTGDINNAFAGVDEQDVASREALATRPYNLKDEVYFEALSKFGLEASDQRKQGSFRFIHLYGAHTPYTMDENAVEHPTPLNIDTTTVEQQTRGTIYVVSEYLRQLKDLGLYDQATIIVTSDHGTYEHSIEPLSGPVCGFMVVKPGNQTAEEAANSCAVSWAPVGQEDFCATVISAVGGDSSKYGRSVTEVGENEDRERFFNMLAADSNSDWGVREYAIKGNALDFANWRLTGYYWDGENWHKTPSDADRRLSDIDFAMPGVDDPVLCGEGTGR